MTNELLRRYAVDGSEAAFTELVRQHINLVYSAALRQVNGDAGAAQDITQAVFTDLARKACQLASHSSLTGWLYTSARFQAAKSRRSEQRRHTREQESHTMNQLLQTGDPEDAWLDVRRVLDDLMHELNDTDREAILLRYFERKALAEIGARLGLSENAARMRVDRALEKLRSELSKRGITSTAAALGLALTERAVGAAPASLVAEVSQSALASVGANASVASSLSKLLGPSLLKWVGAAALASLGVALLIRHVVTAEVPAPVAAKAPTATQPAANVPSQSPLPAALSTVLAAPLDTTNKMTLHIVTADSGKPVPDVQVDYWVWDGKVHHKKPLPANRLGICEVPVPRSTITKLILVSERDGFADTRLQWHTDQGEKIPQEYTLRLPRAVTIGGTVLDADGNPVSGAKIGFNNRPNPNPDSELLTETCNFGWPFWIEVASDSAGHWEINRIAQETVQTLDGGADHPEHLPASVSVGDNPATVKQLLSGTYIFHLGRAAEVHGEVRDLSGKPVSGARVRVGYAAMVGTRRTKTDSHGSFSVGGCKAEKTPLSADADGFAATTMEVDLTTNRGPFHLVLQPGKLLRLRVVDASGKAISTATVFLNNLPQFNGVQEKAPAIQADFEKKTDADGRVEWESAPDADLSFDVLAGGYNRGNIHFQPDGNEHTITLSSGLTLFGSVTDASTGQPLPAFQIIVGWPTTNFQTGEVGAQWSTLDRFWLKFEGGAFRHLFDEPALGGPSPGFIFKFKADGYAPFITPSYSGGEGEVQLNVAMQPAADLKITVLLPDGRPAVKADVGLVASGTFLVLRPGGFSHDNLQSVDSLLATDAAGHFSLPPDNALKSVIIAHPEGFLETTPGALAANPTAQLQAWSRIEGTLFCEGQPAPGRDVRLLFAKQDGHQSILTDFEQYKITTDHDGHFAFPQAPPGERKLVLMVPFDGGPGHKGWSDRPLTNLDLPPGETITITPSTTIPDGTVIRPPAGFR